MVGHTATASRTREYTLTMSYEEFLDWPGHAEWVDGEVTVFMPASELHQDILGFLYVLVSWYGRHKRLGKAMLAPFEMRLPSQRASREPDLIFVRYPWDNRLDGKRLEGPADLVVELISNDSVTRDRRDKFNEYRDVGIPEYWLIDTRDGKWSATFYELTANGDYAAVALNDQGRYHSKVLPGFWPHPTWLWEAPLPDPDALKPIITAGRD